MNDINYYYLIIVSKEKLQFEGIDYLNINDDITLLNEHMLKCNDTTFEFQYLIYTDFINVTYENVDILKDPTPITNMFHQTSLEHIYYVKESKKLLFDINNIINEEQA